MDVTKLLKDGAGFGAATAAALGLLQVARGDTPLSDQTVGLVLVGGLAAYSLAQPQASAPAAVVVLLCEAVLGSAALAALRWHRAHAIRQYVQEEERRSALATWPPAAGRRSAAT